jgi:hypothetical protein
MAATEKFRLPLDFTAEGLAEIERLRKVSGANTRAETIRYAVRLLDWVTEQMSAGHRIAVERNGNWQEVVFPFLPKPKASASDEIPVTVARVGQDVARNYEGMVRQEERVKMAMEEAKKAGKQVYRDALRGYEKT